MKWNKGKPLKSGTYLVRSELNEKEPPMKGYELVSQTTVDDVKVIRGVPFIYKDHSIIFMCVFDGNNWVNYPPIRYPTVWTEL